MLKKVHSKNGPTIALLLVGAFLFTTTILPKAIGVPEVTFEHSDNLENKYQDLFVDRENGTAAAWLSGYRVHNGLQIGHVATYIGASLVRQNNQDFIYYYADASSGIVHSNFNGRANAWVKVPDKPRVGLGADRNLGKGFPITHISEWDSNTINKNLVGGKSMTASAALSAKQARVTVKIRARGI